MLFCYGELAFYPSLIEKVFPLTYGRLSCKPQIAQTIMREPGMKEALEGKLLISILAGVTIAQLQAMVLSSTKVVRAMPNTPCKVRVPFRQADTRPPDRF